MRVVSSLIRRCRLGRDFSAIRRLLEDVRARGIDDFRVFTDVHPEFVERCMSEIRVIDVNQQTLELFVAPDKQTLLTRPTRSLSRRDAPSLPRAARRPVERQAASSAKS